MLYPVLSRGALQVIYRPIGSPETIGYALHVRSAPDGFSDSYRHLFA